MYANCVQDYVVSIQPTLLQKNEVQILRVLGPQSRTMRSTFRHPAPCVPTGHRLFRAERLIAPSRRVVACSANVSLPEQKQNQQKVAIFVEPSPFSHVSGMKIRFTNLIRGLREIGDDVTVVTPCINPPKQFCGAKVQSSSVC